MEANHPSIDAPPAMRLGIIVVYMVPDENGRLLNLHLERVARHTHAPYTIYGYANKLSPELHVILEENENVKLIDIQPFAQRGRREHTYYLERLIEAALEDGVTHVVTLHVDSFPIKSGWDVELAARLSASCVLVSVNDAFTACMCFHRSFYLDYRPSFLLPNEVLETEGYKEYAGRYGYIAHSGIGFLYLIDHTDDLSWYPLTSSNGRIYGDVVFHFRNAILRDIKRVDLDGAGKRVRFHVTKGLRSLMRTVRPLLPAKALSLLPKRKEVRKHVRSFEMTEVVEDFDEYLAGLTRGA